MFEDTWKALTKHNLQNGWKKLRPIKENVGEENTVKNKQAEENVVCLNLYQHYYFMIDEFYISFNYLFNTLTQNSV